MKRNLILPAVIVAALIAFFLWKKPFTKTRKDAKELFDQERYAEAADLIEKLLHKSPNDEILLFDHGIYNSHIGNFETSLNDFNKVLKMHPENDICRLERANIYNNMENHESALSDLAYLLDAKSKGTDAPMWTENSESNFDFSVTITEIIFHRGITYAAMGKFQESYDDFTTCINDAADPTRQYELSDAYYRRGEVLILSNQTEDGCADMQEAIDIGHPFAEEAYGDYCQ